MKMMRIVGLVGIFFICTSVHSGVLQAEDHADNLQSASQTQQHQPSKWQVAGKEVKEATSAVAEATRYSASSTWKGIKQGSSEAWKKTKSGSKELYDAVGEKSKDAWNTTKEESKELWQKGKAALDDAMGPDAPQKPKTDQPQVAPKPDTLVAPNQPQAAEPETYML